MSKGKVIAANNSNKIRKHNILKPRGKYIIVIYHDILDYYKLVKCEQLKIRM